MRIDKITDAVLKMKNANFPNWEFCSDESININGEEFTLSPWRFNRRFLAMRSLAVHDNVLSKICSYKSQNVLECNKDLRKVLYAELDLCEWLIDDKIISFYVSGCENKILSLILRTKKGVLCNIEIALTLSPDSAPVIGHEIVGKEGMISDRSINEQIPVNSVYLFEQDKKMPESFTDMDADMLGMDPYEIMVSDNIIDLLKSMPDYDVFLKESDRLFKLTELVFQSVDVGDIISVSEEML